MFKIRIWYGMDNVKENAPYDIGIKYISCDNIFGCEFENQTVKGVITTFVTNMVFQHVVMS